MFHSLLGKVLAGVIGVVGFLFLMGILFRPEFKEDILPKVGKQFTAQNAPSCPEPLVLQTPVDLSKVTAILYPGQERGGDFKAHGGFRFNNSKAHDVQVVAAMDATLQEASRYLEKGEVQYMFDLLNECGIRYRYDHLSVLAPKFADVVKDLPEPKDGDSRTTRINKEVKVTKGEVIATSVGLNKSNNVFADVGVYDMRKGKDYHNLRESAICWFDLLSKEDAKKVRSLPAGDSKSGSQSLYCK